MKNKKYFHTMNRLCYDPNRLRKINEKLEELYKEKDALEEDMGYIAGAVRAASKNLTGDSPTTSEQEAFQHLMDNYGAFIKSESESENESANEEYAIGDASKKEDIDRKSDLGKIMETKDYMRKELVVNSSILKKTLIKYGKTPLYPRKPRNIDELDESSEALHPLFRAFTH